MIRRTVNDYFTAAGNTVVTETIAAAGASKRHTVSKLAGSYSAAPTGGKLTVADETGTLFEADVIAGGPFNFDFHEAPLRARPNSALTITLAAAGGAIVGKLTVVRGTEG